MKLNSNNSIQFLINEWWLPPEQQKLTLRLKKNVTQYTKHFTDLLFLIVDVNRMNKCDQHDRKSITFHTLTDAFFFPFSYAFVKIVQWNSTNKQSTYIIDLLASHYVFVEMIKGLIALNSIHYTKNAFVCFSIFMVPVFCWYFPRLIGTLCQFCVWPFSKSKCHCW